MQTKRTHLRLFGLLGLAATLLVGMGEFLMHFSAQGYGGEPFSYLAKVPDSRITWGHFLMVAGLPLYFAGYWFIYQTLGRSRWALAVLVTAVVSFSTGGIWVTSRAMLVKIVQARATATDAAALDGLLVFYENHYEILVQALRVLILLLSFFWVMAVLKGRTIYPKWMAVFSPILLLVMVFLSYLLLPAFGKYLVPTAMNAAHLAFFGLTFYHFSKSNT
ncbi:MAG: hypothetical protein GC192_22905 [Bacteroidetes bacterium]|nr:hypothetical protein [Bacteroidota bacterium]